MTPDDCEVNLGFEENELLLPSRWRKADVAEIK